MINSRSFISISLITLLSFMIIYYSVSFLDYKLPDSSSYLNYSPKYKSFYPFLINFVDSLNLNLIYVQILFLSFSIVFLIFSIFKKYNLFISLVLYIAIIINFFYTSFSKTILTESIFFGLINIGIGLFVINNSKNLNYYFYCLILALLFSIKSIGFIVVLCFLFLNFLRKDKFNYLKCFLIILLFVVLENIIFYKKNDIRSSVLGEMILGKIFFLSGKQSFEIQKYPEIYKAILQKSKNYFVIVHNNLNEIKSFPTKVELKSDYEVIAQFQFYEELNTEEKKIYQHMYNNKILILGYLLKNNFIDYLNLSISHFFGQWVAGFKQEYLKKNYLPKSEQILLSSGGIKITDSLMIKIGQNFLIVLFAFFQIIFLISLIRFFLNKKDDSFYFIIFSQIYLLVVSFVNISTVRYLMPMYPIIILACLIFLKEIVKKKYVFSTRY